MNCEGLGTGDWGLRIATISPTFAYAAALVSGPSFPHSLIPSQLPPSRAACALPAIRARWRV